ncbi:MAG: TonB-dependent receptor [Filimonas sp.]|nr:TonB-dependent receptor [Filimonas sp.]
MKKLCCMFLLLALGALPAFSQAVMKGQVVDKQSGEPLQGALVQVTLKEGKKAVALTGLNGQFVFRNVSSASHKVTVTYVGYETTATELTPGTELSITLDRTKNDLQNVTVSGKTDRGGEKYTMQIDRKADIVQNSVSARAIEISPDLTVANVTQRVSGVSLERSTNGEGQYPIIRGMDKRYIYTLVNGIKIPSPDNKNRYVPLDIFPSDLMDRIEVSKALLPNMEGDAIGGAVNMVMKDAPATFSVKANAAVGFANKFFTEDFTRFNNGPSLNSSPRQLNGSAYQAGMQDFPNSAFTYIPKHNPLASVLGLSIGNRFLHDKLGVLVAGSYQNTYRNVNTVFFDSETDRNTNNAVVTSIEQRHYSIQQQRTGLHSKLDYKFDNNNKLNLYVAYMNLEKNEYRSVSDTSLELGRQGPGTGRISNSYRTIHDVQQIFNATLNGEHSLTKRLSLNWSAVYSKATDNNPDVAKLNVVTGVAKDPVTGNLVQAPHNLDASSSRQFFHNSDEDKSGYLNLKYRTGFGKSKWEWSVGGMYRDKSRSSTYDNYNLRPTNPSIQTYDGDISKNNFYVFNPAGTFDDALNYDAKEKIAAGYAMLKVEWKKLDITGGARYEHTDLTWINATSTAVKGKTGSINYYDVLPSVSAKYALSKRQALRFSYYSAISRPNFYDIVPHIGGDNDADWKESGNPNLKRTTAENFDLRYELFPHDLDQLLAGVFYKRLNNPIEYALENVGTNVYYIPDNFGNASNYGFELDFVKFFRWFGVKANYTFTNSEITTTKVRRFSTPTGQSSELVSQTRPLQGQSKHIGNISVFVKDDNKLGLNAQLALGYTSRRINTVSQYLDNDIWQKGFAQLDFSVEKRVVKHWYVYAKVNNLLNTPAELEIRQPYTGAAVVGDVPYQEKGKNVFIRKDTYGMNFLLGVRFKL